MIAGDKLQNVIKSRQSGRECPAGPTATIAANTENGIPGCGHDGRDIAENSSYNTTLNINILLPPSRNKDRA
jgi:hypothetical protein